ncbi:DsbA family protein [Microlunatus ginsengisoli]|uniref:Thioredoxin-like fold domain-containing protein n=1 Tax=Microlunatus ginsengisoli TaxID=363863 RepID=A0ABP6ZMJ0_9ACTN
MSSKPPGGGSKGDGAKGGNPKGGNPKSGNARDRARQREEQARRRKRDRRILIIVSSALVVLLVGGGIVFQAWRTSRAPSVGPAPSASGSVSFAPVTITNGQPIVLGKAGAPVTIKLYEDFHCPHCAEFEEAFGSTITAAQNAGTVAVALYPMSFIDQGSVTAANAMACAAEEGFGQAYYTGLFANHTLQWTNEQLISLADQVTGGKTPSGFSSCVQQNAHQSWVDSINTAAGQAGVNQTPTMFIGDSEVDISTLTVDKLNQLIADAAKK